MLINIPKERITPMNPKLTFQNGSEVMFLQKRKEKNVNKRSQRKNSHQQPETYLPKSKKLHSYKKEIKEC